MTRIPVFSYSGNLARYWRRKTDWRQSQEPDETAYIPCRNAEMARGDLAEFLLQIDPDTNIFFDGDYGELVDITEVRQAAKNYGWRQRSAQFKQEIGLDQSPTSSPIPPPKISPPNPSKSWASSWKPLQKLEKPTGSGDRPLSPQPTPDNPTKTIPSALFELIDLLGQSQTSTQMPLPHSTGLIQAYQTLRLTPTQNWDAIQRAYRDRSRATHPDHGGDQSEFQAVQEAYETLKQRYRPRRSP